MKTPSVLQMEVLTIACGEESKRFIKFLINLDLFLGLKYLKDLLENFQNLGHACLSKAKSQKIEPKQKSWKL
jgi:hypothetical protein